MYAHWMETRISATLLLEFYIRYISILSVYNLPRLHTSNVDRSNKRKWLFTKKKKEKARSRRDSSETITDADYTDHIAFLANGPAQIESLLQSLEQAAGDIGLYVNANKTEYMCYNRDGTISTLNGDPLKLVDNFAHLDSSVSSTESDVDIRLAKAWIAIDRLS